MPTPLTHAVVGGAVGGIVALVVRGLGGEMDVFTAMTVGAISGALPDIDSIFEPFADHTKPRNGLFRHRGITHSMVVMPLLAALLVPMLLVSVPLWSYEHLQWGVVVGITYLSHMIIDPLNEEPAHYFWPIVPTRVGSWLSPELGKRLGDLVHQLAKTRRPVADAPMNLSVLTLPGLFSLGRALVSEFTVFLPFYLGVGAVVISRMFFF